MNVYLAGPLFSQAERLWNQQIARALRGLGHRVFLPQEEAEPFTKVTPIDAAGIFRRMMDGIAGAEIVVAIVDGTDADSGTAWECGFAAAKGIPVVMFRSDFRKSGDDDQAGINIMLARSAREVVLGDYATVAESVDAIDSALRRLG